MDLTEKMKTRKGLKEYLGSATVEDAAAFFASELCREYWQELIIKAKPIRAYGVYFSSPLMPWPNLYLVERTRGGRRELDGLPRSKTDKEFYQRLSTRKRDYAYLYCGGAVNQAVNREMSNCWEYGGVKSVSLLSSRELAGLKSSYISRVFAERGTKIIEKTKKTLKIP